MSLGDRLKKARTSKGITQDKLSKMLGTSRGVITNLEYGKIDTPQPLIINSICALLEINKDWLLYGIGEMDSSESIKSKKILDELYTIASEFSVDELIYILDVIKSYKKHLENR